MLNDYEVELQSGKLEITVFDSRCSLHELLDFGSRQNPKRKYLFISKILGKYIPCRPSSMRASYRLLAEGILSLCSSASKIKPIWVMGVAETATGLGAGVAQEIKAGSKSDVIFSHTTRYKIPHDLAFSIEEAHSHAPTHLIYELERHLQASKVDTVVLVDDEISTGKTLNELTRGLKNKLPQLKQVIWVSLVNWLSEEEKNAYKKENAGIQLHFHGLLNGAYRFYPYDHFNLGFPDQTAMGISSIDNRMDTGRIGYRLGSNEPGVFTTPKGKILDIDDFDKKTPYSVIGTGEFTYQPFLFAEQMEQFGFDVLFQSTGRSPVLSGNGIERKQSYYDPNHKGTLYLYNLPPDRHPIMLYETLSQYRSCKLNSEIEATVAILR